MYRVPARASRGLRLGCLTLAAVVALLAISSDDADARSKRKRHHVKRSHAAKTYNPPYAAIVVDAKTGSVLHQTSADSPRHPASLTKIMTLYLLFEQLEAGKIKLDTPLEVSQAASVQPPTKLGLKPGQTIKVEEAIGSLVTKSANDAAVAVSEAIGGSEEEFARMMTRKARALGMRNTVYRNASGLPNDEQITTARDQAALGVAIQQRFPRYYRYFSMTSYDYHGSSLRNHNKLLGRVEGVDGIKTGFTNASGFNLVTSVRRDGRHIVAVVLGGSTARQRDARMRDLINSKIAQASTKGAATAIAEAPPLPLPEPAPPSRPQLASAGSTPLSLTPPQRVSDATSAIPSERPGSSAPIKPVKVKTLAVTMVPPKGSPAPERFADLDAQAPETKLSEAAPPAGARPGILGTLPKVIASAGNAAVSSAKADEAPARQVDRQVARQAPRHGWAIQVGALEDESSAKERLSAAHSKASSLLEKADAYTERTTKGGKTYYRARFAVSDRDQAEAACKRLKRSDIPCMALKI